MKREASEVLTLTWTDTGVDTDVAPDTDTEIPVHGAERITIQVDSLTLTGHSSTDWDINVESSPDGTYWDTVAYASVANVGNDAIESFSVTPGPAFIRLRLDNNALATTCYVKARVLIIA